MTNNNNFKIQIIQEHPLLVDTKERLVIPQSLAKSLLSDIHLWLQHPGEKAIYMSIKDYLLFPNIKVLCEEVTKECVDCQVNKKTNNKYGTLKGNLFNNKPYEFISSDIVGPFKTEHYLTGHFEDLFYIVTFTDLFSRWSEVRILFDTKADTICESLQICWLSKFPCPLKILTDNVRQYIASTFRQFCKERGIKNIYTTTYNPTSNSVSERINQAISTTLRINKGTEMHTLEEKINRRLNLVVNRNLNVSPYEALNMQSPLDPLQRNIDSRVEEIETRMETKVSEAEEKRNKGRIAHTYKEGELVMKKNLVSEKLDDIWRGPYEIFKVIDTNRVILSEDCKRTNCNIKMIRPYIFMRKEQDVVPSKGRH